MNEPHRDGCRCRDCHHSFPLSVGLGLLIAAAIAWTVTASLAGECRADMDPLTGPGVCDGWPAVAYHLQPVATPVLIILAGIGVLIMVAARRV